MGSVRLPDKVFAQIGGHPMLWHVLKRVQGASLLDQIIVAIPETEYNNPLLDFCVTNNIECFMGSELDVLDRFYQSAKRYEASIIYRITSDCPFINPKAIDMVVSAYLSNNYDYVYNCVDGAAFSFNALEQAWCEAKSSYEREHVVPYITESGRFRKYFVKNEFDLSKIDKIRWYVNERNDLEYVRRIYKAFYPNELFTLSDIINLVEKNPEFKSLFNSLFFKSLKSSNHD
jgi:spore coat polysaccharide biosynthesis protein SpsF (cytidylyltransferase family)